MIYIVSGFFRSGTSMMMQALEAGGLPVYYSRERNAFNEVHTDISHRPNPNGLYEPSTQDMAELAFPRQHNGKAVKILIPWLSSLRVDSDIQSVVTYCGNATGLIGERRLGIPDVKLHDGLGYRIIVMRRNPEAIMGSYERNFHDFWDSNTRSRWIAEYAERLKEAIRWFLNRRDVLSVDVLNFEALLDDPSRLNTLDWPIDASKAAAIIRRKEQCLAA